MLEKLHDLYSVVLYFMQYDIQLEDIHFSVFGVFLAVGVCTVTGLILDKIFNG